MSDIGELGEQLVAAWLRTQGWKILHHRWHCRWGEIDLIACSGKQERENARLGEQKNFTPSPPRPLTPTPLLAFVEVKTRSRGNWDAGGLLAITPTKQAKLWQTAELFLAERPDLATMPCRFDVALVTCQRICGRSHRNDTSAIDQTIPVASVQLGQPVLVPGYQLILHDYIPSAFG